MGRDAGEKLGSMSISLLLLTQAMIAYEERAAIYGRNDGREAFGVSGTRDEDPAVLAPESRA